MKSAYSTILLSSLLLACSQAPIKTSSDDAAYQVSDDYEAVGDASGIHPFIYGKHTLIKFEQGKSFSPTITDEHGATVKYKTQGNYFLLDRKLNSFTVSGLGQPVKFSLIPPTAVVEQDNSVDISNVTDFDAQEYTNMNNSDSVVQKKIHRSDPIYAIMYTQMLEQRNLLGIASNNPKLTGEELLTLNNKLNDLEAKIAQGNTAIVHVYFPFNKTEFKPEKNLIDTLLPLARDASKINIYGRTDSKVADMGNKIVANGRSEAAKEFLLAHGVSEDVIHASWRASGDFIAPADIEEGRKFNRRVTIEVFPK